MDHHPNFDLHQESISSLSIDPSYVQFFTESLKYFQKNIWNFWFVEPKTGRDSYFKNDFFNDVRLLYEQIRVIDIYLVILISILLTIGRHLITKYLIVPFTKRCGIPTADAKKIPESAWKFLFYLITWSCCSYYLFIRKNGDYFKDPSKLWNDYSMHNSADPFIYFLYMAELSFYIHSLYTTMMVDQRRKDTNTLMFHHIICVFLIMLSYCNKSHKCGMIALFLHDGCDILLEGIKLIRYFKVQHGHSYEWVEIFVNIGFISFMLSWLLARLYWFPLKVIFMASIYLEQRQILGERLLEENRITTRPEPVPFITIMVAMLWIILMMNFYWFTFAIRLLYKVATRQINELEDTTEFENNKQPLANKENINGGHSSTNQMQKEDNSNSKEPFNNDIGQAANEEQRKFSVDSGVVLISSNTNNINNGGGHQISKTLVNNKQQKQKKSGSESDESGQYEYYDEHESSSSSSTTSDSNTVPSSASSGSSISYNLRQRKAKNMNESTMMKDFIF